VGFEILLEGRGFGCIMKCDGDFNPPGTVICSGLHFSLIVLFDSTLQIARESRVMPRGISNATELVNVVEHVASRVKFLSWDVDPIILEQRLAPA
jgi:hypothetical protein